MFSAKKHFVKLSKMSAAEIHFRTKQKARIEIEKICFKFAPNGIESSLFTPKQISSISFLTKGKKPSNITFLGLSEDAKKLKKAYKELFPEEFARTINQAEKILQHRFHFLGKDISFRDQIDWNRNPVSGQAYPKQHYSTIAINNTEKYGDIKYLWELNRHQFFIELGKAYYLTGDEKYALQIREFIVSWIESNPYKLTVNWTSALESSVRIFSWIWTFYFTKDSRIWETNFKEVFLRNLVLEGNYIEENRSYYYSPYNHLIGELAALSFLGTIFPDLLKCKNWGDEYWHELEEQFDRQFHSDGFTVEQAAYYHHFTLGFYLMIALLRDQNNLSVSTRIRDKMEQALDIVMHMTRPDGRLPMIGDIDNARSTYFCHPRDQWDLRAFLALGAVIFNRSDMKYVAGDVREEVLWLLGYKGVEKYQQLAKRKPEFKSKAFKHSGYFIMRDGWEESSHYCCFDCGEIAHGVHKDNTPSAAHGHADILSFELSIDGKPLIIDPGFHTYFGSKDWHEYFRSTQAHNSITVNDCGQARHEGPIAWSTVSSSHLIHWLSTSQVDFVSGKIDSFAGLEKGIFHRRHILFHKPLYFLIMDEINGKPFDKKNYTVESFLHFSQGDLKCNDMTAFRNKNRVLLLTIPDNSAATIENGGVSPNQGWASIGYGYRQPVPVLKIVIRDNLPVNYGMLFPTFKIQNFVQDFSMSRKISGIIEYRIHTPTWKEFVYLNPARKLFRLPDLIYVKTDALCVTLRRKNQKFYEITAIQGTYMLIDNKAVTNREYAGIGLVVKKNKKDFVVRFRQ